MIVYGMNRLPLAQESNEELALATEAQAESGAKSSAVPTHVAAEGSSELAADADLLGAVQTEDEDDSRPPIKKSLKQNLLGAVRPFDEDDSRPPIKKSLKKDRLGVVQPYDEDDSRPPIKK